MQTIVNQREGGGHHLIPTTLRQGIHAYDGAHQIAKQLRLRKNYVMEITTTTT